MSSREFSQPTPMRAAPTRLHCQKNVSVGVQRFFWTFASRYSGHRCTNKYTVKRPAAGQNLGADKYGTIVMDCTSQLTSSITIPSARRPDSQVAAVVATETLKIQQPRTYSRKCPPEKKVSDKRTALKSIILNRLKSAIRANPVLSTRTFTCLTRRQDEKRVEDVGLVPLRSPWTVLG